MAKKKRSQQAANREYAKRANLDVEVAGELGKESGRHNARAITEHDKANQRKKQK